MANSVGFEPTTYALQERRSATELYDQRQDNVDWGYKLQKLTEGSHIPEHPEAKRWGRTAEEAMFKGVT